MRVCVRGCGALANPPPEHQLVLWVFFSPLFALCSLKQVSQWRQDTDECCHCQRESCDEVVCFFCSATQFFSLPSSCVVIFQFSYTFTNNQNARFLKTDVMGLIIGSSTFCIDSSNNESFTFNQFCPTPSFSLERKKLCR